MGVSVSVDIRSALLDARRYAYLTVVFMDRCSVNIIKRLCEGGVDVRITSLSKRTNFTRFRIDKDITNG